MLVTESHEWKRWSLRSTALVRNDLIWANISRTESPSGRKIQTSLKKTRHQIWRKCSVTKTLQPLEMIKNPRPALLPPRVCWLTTTGSSGLVWWPPWTWSACGRPPPATAAGRLCRRTRRRRRGRLRTGRPWGGDRETAGRKGCVLQHSKLGTRW